MAISAQCSASHQRWPGQPISARAPLGHYVCAAPWSSDLVGACSQSERRACVSQLSDWFAVRKESSTLRKAIGNQSDKMHVRRGFRHVPWRQMDAKLSGQLGFRHVSEELLSRAFFLVATRSNICAGCDVAAALVFVWSAGWMH